MKSISAAIIVVAGVYGIVGSLPQTRFHAIGIFVGVITTALGLVGWSICLKYDR